MNDILSRIKNIDTPLLREIENQLTAQLATEKDEEKLGLLRVLYDKVSAEHELRIGLDAYSDFLDTENAVAYGTAFTPAQR